MKEELDQALCARYPLLFKRNGRPVPYWGFEVADGWYGLLDTLFEALYAPYRQAQYAYEQARKYEGVEIYPGAEVTTAVDVERKRLAMVAAAEQLPRVVQVKEKFAELRCYVNNANEQAHAYIEFAERMSARVCEDCGAPGKRRTGGWMRTLCDEHEAQRQAKLQAR